MRKRGSVCELEERERGIDGERGKIEQCQVRNSKPVSMEQLFVIQKTHTVYGEKLQFTALRK